MIFIILFQNNNSVFKKILINTLTKSIKRKYVTLISESNYYINIHIINIKNDSIDNISKLNINKYNFQSVINL